MFFIYICLDFNEPKEEKTRRIRWLVFGLVISPAETVVIQNQLCHSSRIKIKKI